MHTTTGLHCLVFSALSKHNNKHNFSVSYK